MTATTAKPVVQTTPTPAIQPPEPVKSNSNLTASPNLESQRVSALLDLNRVLLQEVVALQNAKGKGPNAPQPQQNPPKITPPPADDVNPTTAISKSKPDAAPPAKQEGEPDNNNNNTTTTSPPIEESKNRPSTGPDQAPAQTQPQQQPSQTPNPKIVASKEYIEYMRRLQANLAYLASVADRHHKPGNAVPQFPAIMEAPNLPLAKEVDAGGKEEGGDVKGSGNDLKEIYKRLRELWPEYKGKPTVTATAGAAAGGTQGPGATATTTMATAT